MCIEARLERSQNRLEHKRDERVEMMEQFSILNHKVGNMIDSWNGFGDADITKPQLAEFPRGVWVELSKGVQIRKRTNLPGEVLVFDTNMEKGAAFGLHMHSDCLELCDVVDGKLFDLKRNESYFTGQRITYQKGERHHLIALKNARLVVYFK